MFGAGHKVGNYGRVMSISMLACFAFGACAFSLPLSIGFFLDKMKGCLVC